eukprot:Rmarinus@m.9137
MNNKTTFSVALVVIFLCIANLYVSLRATDVSCHPEEEIGAPKERAVIQGYPTQAEAVKETAIPTQAPHDLRTRDIVPTRDVEPTHVVEPTTHLAIVSASRAPEPQPQASTAKMSNEQEIGLPAWLTSGLRGVRDENLVRELYENVRELRMATCGGCAYLCKLQVIQDQESKLSEKIRPTSNIRLDFVIVGAAKGGTTDAYANLKLHPSIQMPNRKEVHFYENNCFMPQKDGATYDQLVSSTWCDLAVYKQNLPRGNANSLVGEASPAYDAFPGVITFIHATFPQTKLIFMLRDPVARAWSHYWYMNPEGQRSFATVFDEEAGVWQQCLMDVEMAFFGSSGTAGVMKDRVALRLAYDCFIAKWFSREVPERRTCEYGTLLVTTTILRSMYYFHVSEALRYFPASQIHVVKSEDYFSDPHRVSQGMCDFLGVLPGELPPKDEKVENMGRRHDMKLDDQPELKQRLQELFSPLNEALYDLLREHNLMTFEPWSYS